MRTAEELATEAQNNGLGFVAKDLLEQFAVKVQTDALKHAASKANHLWQCGLCSQICGALNHEAAQLEKNV